MLEVQYLRDKQTKGSQSLKNVGFEFDTLLLGMMTVFGLELTEKQICQNIKTLFKQLKLPGIKGLTSTLRCNLASLQSNGLIIRQEGGYIISEKGESVGKRVLKHFRQNFTN
ncbi:MAG: hypothetical protein ACFFDI_30395 [Promethearchaeota archaeon]